MTTGTELGGLASQLPSMMGWISIDSGLFWGIVACSYVFFMDSFCSPHGFQKCLWLLHFGQLGFPGG